MLADKSKLFIEGLHISGKHVQECVRVFENTALELLRHLISKIYLHIVALLHFSKPLEVKIKFELRTSPKFHEYHDYSQFKVVVLSFPYNFAQNTLLAIIL